MSVPQVSGKENNNMSKKTTNDSTNEPKAPMTPRELMLARKGKPANIVQSALSLTEAREATKREAISNIFVLSTENQEQEENLVNYRQGRNIRPGYMTEVTVAAFAYMSQTRRAMLAKAENPDAAVRVSVDVTVRGWDVQTDAHGTVMKDDKGNLLLITKDEDGNDLEEKDLMTWSVSWTYPYGRRTAEPTLTLTAYSGVPRIENKDAKEGESRYGGTDWARIKSGFETQLKAIFNLDDPTIEEIIKLIPESASVSASADESGGTYKAPVVEQGGTLPESTITMEE